MTQVMMSRTLENEFRDVIEKINLREEEFIVDVFGPLRIWSEPEDYDGINIEVAEGYRRLAVRLAPIEAARLAMRLSRFLLKYISAKHFYYYESINRLEKDIDQRIEAVTKPSIVYAGNDQIAINKVSSELREFKRLFHSLDKLADKHNLAYDLLDIITEINNGLETIYKALHII